MKLSGMRDGPKKSVTVPEIPGQLGPMDSSCSRMLLEWTISDEDDECEDCHDKRRILKKKN